MYEESLSEIVGTDQCYRIQSSIRIKAGIEEVWETATNSEKMGWWFAPAVVEGEGGRIQLNYADGKFGMAGDVKVLFRPHVLEFTWDAHELSDETIIRFDFVPTGIRSTQATVTSFVFDKLETAYLVIATWQFMLERLEMAIASQAAIPDDEARVEQLATEFKRRYELRLPKRVREHGR